MPSSAYVETSVISYLTARQSQDVISMLAVDEAGAGDADAAAQRAQAMAGLPILELTDSAQALDASSTKM